MHYTIKNSILKAIFSQKGAELQSLTNKDREFIWEGNPVVWGKHAPVLFPIVGTLKNNQFEYNNAIYQLPRHGFARDMEFQVTDHKINSITFLLESTRETLKIYPFHFQLYITYTVENNCLKTAYKIHNPNTNRIFFSIGAHPAFALPLRFEDYELLFEEENPEYHLLENDLLSKKTRNLVLNDKKLQLHYELFKDDALVFQTIASKKITIIEHSKPLLKVHFDCFPDLGIWTKPNAPFLCIEPWFGFADYTDATGLLKEKKGIHILEPSLTFESEFTIEILYLN